MRTIKLRVFHNGKIFGYEELRADGWYSMCPELNPDKGERWDRIVMTGDGFTRVQSTGLRDKNGKEIYEHDLVKAKRGNTSLGDMNDIYEIVWHDEYACFCYKCVKSDNFYRVGKIAESRSHPFFVTQKITEVIGNQFEHPNLLK